MDERLFARRVSCTVVGTCQVLDYFGQGGHALTPFSFAVSTIHNQPDRYHTLDRRACTHARAMVAPSPPGEVTSDAAARASTYLRIASSVLALEDFSRSDETCLLQSIFVVGQSSLSVTHLPRAHKISRHYHQAHLQEEKRCLRAAVCSGRW